MSAPTSVWLVLQDESPIEPVLGVFGDPHAAQDYADVIRTKFSDGAVFVTSYGFGWTHDAGARPHRTA